MIAHMVTVRPNSSERYMDSIWLSESSALARVDALIGEFVRRGNSAQRVVTSEGWAAWVSECTIEDASVAGTKPTIIEPLVPQAPKKRGRPSLRSPQIQG
jgi:hypothetical protein